MKVEHWKPDRSTDLIEGKEDTDSAVGRRLNLLFEASWDGPLTIVRTRSKPNVSVRARVTTGGR
jgi:hypothetical protein